MCGEHISVTIGIPRQNGSAPRVRGTRVTYGRVFVPPRFSPACAGNTRKCAHHRAISAVQPRVCGEHASSVYTSDVLPGSAPRVRGTLVSKTLASARRRFSPACAGNTLPGSYCYCISFVMSKNLPIFLNVQTHSASGIFLKTTEQIEGVFNRSRGAKMKCYLQAICHAPW